VDLVDQTENQGDGPSIVNLKIIADSKLHVANSLFRNDIK